MILFSNNHISIANALKFFGENRFYRFYYNKDFYINDIFNGFCSDSSLFGP